MLGAPYFGTQAVLTPSTLSAVISANGALGISLGALSWGWPSPTWFLVVLWGRVLSLLCVGWLRGPLGPFLFHADTTDLLGLFIVWEF